MKANELTIGDWVYSPEGELCKVHAIEGRFKAFVTTDNYAHDDGTFYLYSIEEIRPVPLTLEILEKNGFTKATPPPGIHARCYELDNKKDRYNLTIADYNKYKRLLLDVDSEDSECFNIKCDYAHQLQHALRLCGIYKEIKL